MASDDIMGNSLRGTGGGSSSLRDAVTMRAMTRREDVAVPIGAIRSKVVAAACGVSRSKLQYWHSTLITPAKRRPGRRGVPRFYTWEEYSKVRAAVKLQDLSNQVGQPTLSTQRIRQALQHLDSAVPEWWTKDLGLFGRSVMIDLSQELRVAEVGQQLAMRDVVLVEDAFRAIANEGVLGQLHRFSDYVDMRPEVLNGNPTIRNRRVEPEFVAALAGLGMSSGDIAENYYLSEAQIESALNFVAALESAGKAA